MSIPEYRYINPDLVLVNPEAGTGFIGLETKHIDVVQEGSGVSNVANLTLGNIVAVKDPLDPALYSPDPANANAQIYTGISNVSATKSGTVHNNEIVTFDMGADSVAFTAYANASGGYNGYVWLEGQSGTAVAGNTTIETQHYFHQKLLPIQANSVGTTFTISTPANAFQTARAVTTTGSGTITVTGNVEGLTNGDKVRFAGANATNFTNAPYTIFSETDFFPSSIRLYINLETTKSLNLGSGNISLFSALLLRDIIHFSLFSKFCFFYQLLILRTHHPCLNLCYSVNCNNNNN